MFKVIGISDVLMIAWAVSTTLLWLRARRLIQVSDNPLLALSHKERKARARRQAQRQEDQENQRLIEQTLQHLQEGKTFL